MLWKNVISKRVGGAFSSGSLYMLPSPSSTTSRLLSSTSSPRETATNQTKTKSQQRNAKKFLTEEEATERLLKMPLDKLTPKNRGRVLGLRAQMWHLRKDESPKPSEPKPPVSDLLVESIKLQGFGKQKKKKGAKDQTKKAELNPQDKFFFAKIKFVAAARTPGSFPPESLPEIAFLGRSNVGKSSLLNALTGSGVARTSPQPGKTKTINWFELSGDLFLVDLPGYGFAFAKETARETWQKNIFEYISSRTTLKRLMLLLDARHSPKPSDLETIKAIQRTKKKFQIILTKTDELYPEALAQRYTEIAERFKYIRNGIPRIMMVSSRTKTGISELRKELMKLRLK